MKSNFSEIIERMFKAGNMRNYSEIAKGLGISPQAISNYKRRGEISPGIILKFAKTFGVSVDWLLTGEGDVYQNEYLSSKTTGKLAAYLTGSEKYKIHYASEDPAFLEPEEIVCIGKLLKIMRCPRRDAVQAIKLSIDAFYKDSFPF
ncbi:MAG: helix-turn-helix domain-containing protein [Deltaproteobacteria bacterium]|nr:helix-turn-helix domain-containing protein [Deltaproteobacteria bacterium]